MTINVKFVYKSNLSLWFSTLHKKVSYRAATIKLAGISALLKDA